MLNDNEGHNVHDTHISGQSSQNGINQTVQSDGTRDLRNIGFSSIEELSLDRNRLLPSIFELPRRLRRIERRSTLRQDPSKFSII